MKYLFSVVLLGCLILCFGSRANHVRLKHGRRSKHVLRIAIAGLGIESSTFSPALTDEAAFHARYGTHIFSIYPFFSADSSLRKRAIWVPTIDGHALPGGAVTREAYESLVN